MTISRFLYRFLFIPRKIKQFFFVHYNRVYFRLAGIKVGKNLVARNKVYLSTSINSTIEIGNNFTIVSGGCINPLSRNVRSSIHVSENAKLTIGNNSGISSSCIWVRESVSIGNFVNIGANVVIIDTDAHSLDWRIRMTQDDSRKAKSAPISIGDSVLIGTGSIVLKGVSIGEHSIIGAGSVVCKDIPANCIAAGNPAKVIKFL